jgi:tetratricopeptide (TPR) repeat protein
MIEKGMNEKLMRDYHHLLGLIELKRGNYALAIEKLQKALDLFPYVQSFYRLMFTEPLAKTYYQSRDLDMAQKTYEDILSLHIGRHYAGEKLRFF